LNAIIEFLPLFGGRLNHCPKLEGVMTKLVRMNTKNFKAPGAAAILFFGSSY
jgi:hypothetical protein